VTVAGVVGMVLESSLSSYSVLLGVSFDERACNDSRENPAGEPEVNSCMSSRMQRRKWNDGELNLHPCRKPPTTAAPHSRRSPIDAVSLLSTSFHWCKHDAPALSCY